MVVMDPAQILSDNGLRNAADIMRAAEAAGVPLHIAAAVIEKESGGANVYGNDRTGVFSNTDPLGERPDPNEVTPTNFARFQERVLELGHTSNGVGPAQITYPGFIKDAKDRGIPLWIPYDNMLYGLRLIAGYMAARNGNLTEVGTLYNKGNLNEGINAYGHDLLAKATAWRNRLENPVTLIPFPAKSKIRTNAFWYQLEALTIQSGHITVTCGPTRVDQGYCYYGAGGHGHWVESRHFQRRALDMNADPASGRTISQYELTHLTAWLLMLRTRYGSAMGLILNRRLDHKDHGHGDDGQSGYQLNGVYDYDAIGDELIFGRNGSRVEEWQRILTLAGYPTSQDGHFGLQTFDNTRKAQWAWGLRPDCVVGPKTLETGKAKAEELAARVAAKDYYVTASVLNVRSGPGTHRPVTTTAKKGERWRVSLKDGLPVTNGQWILGRSDAMYRAKAKPGWVHSDYLELR